MPSHARAAWPHSYARDGGVMTMLDVNRSGLCECGCGAPSPVASRTDTRSGHIKGVPQRFIVGHNAKAKVKHDTGHRMPVPATGYVLLYIPSHPHSHADGFVLEHIVVATKALGKPLPPKALVHHVNHCRSDNQNRNLVICQDQAYHLLLHVRERVLRRGGDPNSDAICSSCQLALPRSLFYKNGAGGNRTCKTCARANANAAQRAKRAAPKSELMETR